jgi:hypothetical protein
MQDREEKVRAVMDKILEHAMSIIAQKKGPEVQDLVNRSIANMANVLILGTDYNKAVEIFKELNVALHKALRFIDPKVETYRTGDDILEESVEVFRTTWEEYHSGMKGSLRTKAEHIVDAMPPGTKIREMEVEFVSMSDPALGGGDFAYIPPNTSVNDPHYSREDFE